MSEQMNGTGNTYSYKGLTVDLASLPEATVRAFVHMGATAYFRDSVASKVSGWKKAAQDKGEPKNDAEIAAYEHDALQDAARRAADGTVAAGLRGPRGTQLETKMKQVAEAFVRAKLKAVGLSLPSLKGDTVDLGGTRLTREELIARQMTRPEVREAAEAQLAKEKALEGAARGVEERSVEALGL